MILSSNGYGRGFANPCALYHYAPILLTQIKPYVIALGLMGLQRVGQPREIIASYKYGDALILIINFITFHNNT